MPNILLSSAIGLVAGLVAAGVMEAFQTFAAKPFGQQDASKDPATVKAADGVSLATTGERVTQKRRMPAGRLVHYGTGAALGIGYCLLVQRWPVATLGFGTAFGVATALVLDDTLVPALGLAPPPWQTPLNTHAYSLAAHLVFGATLEGTRQGIGALVG